MLRDGLLEGMNMDLPVPYKKISTILCVNSGAIGGSIRSWFPGCDIQHSTWLPNLSDAVWMNQPAVVLWFVGKPGVTYRHICGLRTEFPSLPIVLMHCGSKINLRLFHDCKCTVVDILKPPPEHVALEVQLSVLGAFNLVQ